uniref:Secreted protein n=1 Tax=Plectus sambesii TaxID=2011161 RepID=A0A914X3J3_9BILA
MKSLKLLFGLLAVVFLLVKGEQAEGPAYKTGADKFSNSGREGRHLSSLAPVALMQTSAAQEEDRIRWGIVDCGKKIRQQFRVDPGVVYCVNGRCSCNPNYEIASGRDVKINFPNGDWTSGTGWLAEGCNRFGAGCTIGDSAARNSLFEFTYTRGNVWYDISAVNAWTTISPVGMRVSGPRANSSNNHFWCGAVGCNFDVR